MRERLTRRLKNLIRNRGSARRSRQRQRAHKRRAAAYRAGSARCQIHVVVEAFVFGNRPENPVAIGGAERAVLRLAGDVGGESGRGAAPAGMVAVLGAEIGGRQRFPRPLTVESARNGA